MSNLTVSVSPHIHSKRTTTSIMLDVIIALIPAVVASVIIFGARSLLLVFTSVAAAVLAEYAFGKICKKETTIYDLSAVVTGIILALNVPATLPIWQMAIGAVFAVVVVKGLFGGIGQNFANPAATARVMMVLSFGNTMTASVFPQSDTVSSATPMALLSAGAAHKVPDVLDLFLGNCGGALGETCTLAILLGFVYLLARRVITWHTPVAFVATVFLCTWLLGLPPLTEILSGGLMLGAVFMATDYSSTPINSRGRLIFGIGCGLITVLIRKWGSYPEGVSFAILLMNILTPYIDKWSFMRPLGGAKK